MPTGGTPQILQQVVVAGRRLEFFWTRERKGSEPVLIFLHEGLGSARLWREFPAQVSAMTGLPALVYSRYGYGGSDVLQERRSVHYMHQEALVDLPELREILGLDDVILVGHSDGASIALIHTGDGRWPVRSLVLEAPHVMVEAVTTEGIEAAAVAYRTSDLPRRMARHHADGAKTFYGWNRIWLNPAFRNWNIEEYLPVVGCPVLVIQGHDDEYGTVRQVEHIVRQCRGLVETLMLSACGHAPHRDQPEEVRGRIAKFVERCASTRPLGNFRRSRPARKTASS